MGILDGIVEWLAEQVMHGLDLINTSVLGALGCDMAVFLRYFPAAEIMYEVFVALAIGLILLMWVWNLFKNFGLGIGSEAEDPVKLTFRAVLFIALAWYADDIVNIVLRRHTLRLDFDQRPPQPELRGFQLGAAHHHRRVRKRRGGPHCPHPGTDFGVELPEAPV